MTRSPFEMLLQDYSDRLRKLEERERSRQTQTFDLWTIREDDVGQLLATTDEGLTVVLANPTAGTEEPVEAEDDGAVVVPPDDGGGSGDCDCPPGPEGPAGPQGDCSGCPPGEEGPAGDSAYEVAVDNGFVGTEADWLASLVGPGGATGPTGPPGPTFAPTWTTYTPTFSAASGGASLGNGTLRGRYIQAGKLVWYHIRLTWGSTTNGGTGALRFELPVTGATVNPSSIGTGIINDNSAGDLRPRLANYAATAPNRVALLDNGGAVVTATVPWTWANNDVIDINGHYEAA